MEADADFLLWRTTDDVRNKMNALCMCITVFFYRQLPIRQLRSGFGSKIRQLGLKIRQLGRSGFRVEKFRQLWYFGFIYFNLGTIFRRKNKFSPAAGLFFKQL